MSIALQLELGSTGIERPGGRPAKGSKGKLCGRWPAREMSIAERFEVWKGTPGGGQVLCRLYRITAAYHGRWKRTGRGVSQRYLWETLRDRIDGIRRELRRRQIELEPERGFLLNDHFTAHAVRHMIAEHPEWAPMFELRALKAAEV